MKHFLFLLIALLGLLPVQGKTDVGQVLGGLLQLGGQVLEEQTSAQQAGKTPDEQAALSISGITDQLLKSYKEQGRRYAKEVGDIVTQRILEAEKLKETIDSVRILCWVVILYLTVVTIIVLIMLLRLRVLYSRLMNKLNER